MERRHDDHRQQNGRKGEHHIGEAHHHFIEPAAGGRGGDADRAAEGQAEGDDDEGSEEGKARAMEDAAEDIAPEIVGAEEVIAIRRQEAVAQIKGVGIGRREGGREEGDDHGDGDDDEGHLRAEVEAL